MILASRVLETYDHSLYLKIEKPQIQDALEEQLRVRYDFYWSRRLA